MTHGPCLCAWPSRSGSLRPRQDTPHANEPQSKPSGNGQAQYYVLGRARPEGAQDPWTGSLESADWTKCLERGLEDSTSSAEKKKLSSPTTPSYRQSPSLASRQSAAHSARRGPKSITSKETEPASSEADSYRDANFAKSLGTLTVTLCVGALGASALRKRRTM